MKDKKSFVMYQNWGAAIEAMTNEQAGALIKAIYAYQADEEVEFEDPALELVWMLIKQKLDEDLAKYKETCEKRSESGSKGGRPKKQEKAKKANGFFENQEKAKKADNDTDTDNDNDNDNDTDTDNSKELERKARARFTRPSLTEVIAYMGEKEGLEFAKREAERFVDFYTSNGWKVGKNPMKDWKSAANGWIRRSLDSGGSAPSGGRSAPQKSKFSNFNERDYDMSALERSLVT